MAIVSGFDWYNNAVLEGYGNTVIASSEADNTYLLAVYLFDDPAYGLWTDSLVDPDETTAYFAHRWDSYSLAMQCVTTAVGGVDLLSGPAGYGCCIRELDEDEATGAYCSVWNADNTTVDHFNFDAETIDALTDLSTATPNPADEVFEGINQFTTLECPDVDCNDSFTATEFVAVKAQLFPGDEVVEFEYTTVWDQRIEKDMNIQGWIYDPTGADVDAKFAITDTINLE